MKRLEWSEDMSVGVDIIDYQHKNIILDVYNILDDIENNDNIEHIKEMIHDLTIDVKSHLNFEESVLEQYGYPQLSEHILEHRKYSVTVDKLTKALSDNRKELSETLISFVEYWWYSHIMEEDMEYKDFFMEKGIK